MRSNALQLLIYFLAILPLTLAIFADEAYKIDYQHILLGRPQSQNTFFHRPSVNSKASLLYTLSEKHVLGAVNPKDGEIVWRQYLAHGHNATTESFLRVGRDNLIVSAFGNEVSAWDAGDGKLAWRWSSPGKIQDLRVAESIGETGVIISSEMDGKSTITRLDLVEGTMTWQKAIESTDPFLAIATSSSHVYHLSLHSALLKGFKIKVISLDSIASKEVGQAVLTSEHEVALEKDILYVGSNSAAVLVWADSVFKTLRINVLGLKHVTSINVENQGKETITSVHVHGSSLASTTHLLVQYETASSHWAEVYHVDMISGIAKKAYNLPKIDGKGAFSASAMDKNIYWTRVTESEISLTSSASYHILERWPLVIRSQKNTTADCIEDVASEVVPRGNDKFAVRSALTWSSGDWELVRNGEHVWSRDESLAGVVAAAWLDRSPVDDRLRELDMESHDNPLNAYLHRAKRHLRDLRHFPAWVQHLPARLLSSFVAGSQAQAALASNPSFGFQKIILAATAKGRVIALDSGLQGKILWNIDAITIERDARWNVTSIKINGDTAIVLATRGQSVMIDLSSLHVSNFLDSSVEVETLFVVSDGPIDVVGVRRDGTPVQADHLLGNTTTVVTKLANGRIAGWSLVSGVKPTTTWTFTPSAGETIVSLTTRPPHDPVASVGRVLGDRNVLYKYLSPNLLVVTAVNPVRSSASISLLNSISGQILYTTSHHAIDTTKAISTTFAEHWIAYTLFTDPTLAPSVPLDSSIPVPPKAHQLIMTELYESPHLNDRGPLSSSSNFSSLSPLLQTPHAISQAYIIPGPISQLSTTSTLQGITPRALLAIVPNLSGLIVIPLAILTSRRPDRLLSTAEKEEGLLPYSPLLDLAGAWTLSHKREVLGLQGIITTPTKMESTSLVFAYGDVDVFGSRIAPIGAFDVLGAGFGKVSLIGTVVALAIGTGILAPMARRRQIDTLWKS